MEIRNTHHQFENNKAHGISSKASMIPEGNPTLHWTYCSLHGSGSNLLVRPSHPYETFRSSLAFLLAILFVRRLGENLSFIYRYESPGHVSKIKLKRKLLQNKTQLKTLPSCFLLSFIFDMGPGLSNVAVGFFVSSQAALFWKCFCALFKALIQAASY